MGRNPVGYKSEGGVGRIMPDSARDVLIYARVSKPEQDVEHQKDNLWEFATERQDIDPTRIDVVADEQTGTTVDRSGYREMMSRVRSGDTSIVIVREVARLGRTMREISEHAHEIVEDHECGLYVMNDNIEIEPGEELTMNNKMLLTVLSWAAEVEAKKIRENTIAGLRAAERAGKWVGRPPYGFSTNKEGFLQPNDDFSKARDAIFAVEELDYSDRKASKYSGVPRRTIPNVLERKEMYLEEFELPDEEPAE